ncbi:uncharacterized protein LOC101241753 isoform X5 [Hydra vulgaris]|uniref:Uncharacterized protein LOC101241753 isoform X5 n=1 Tax=Hydra vulgaris TaxID=6087 RepID=A0ABM4CHA2_HYDVU
MARFRAKNVVLFLSVAICIILFSLSKYVMRNQTIKNDIYLNPSESEISVVIVDEHHEVIPYWFQAVKEGLINSEGNTLIHIDGHSDMAAPDEFEELDKLTQNIELSSDLLFKIPSSESILLPLMQSNDVFILSAVLTGLINRIIWVTPDWLKLNFSFMGKSYIGWVDFNENKRSYCVCHAFFSKLYLTNYSCMYMNRSSQSLINLDIPSHKCHRLKNFSFLVVNELKFEKVKLNSVKKIFIDIDEDFFGVESGVQAFMDKGLTLKLHEHLNKQLSQIICPFSIPEETYADEAIRNMFKSIIKMKKMDFSSELILSALKRDFIDLSNRFSCISSGDLNNKSTMFSVDTIDTAYKIDAILKNISFLIYQESNYELEALVSARYCLSNSPVFMFQPNFGICSGNIYPDDPLNQIYAGSNQEIEQRGKRLTSILKKINSRGILKFVSVARSLRDGYTPRRQQRAIENVIKRSLEETALVCNKKIKIKYDKHLLFGKKGWIL